MYEMNRTLSIERRKSTEDRICKIS